MADRMRPVDFPRRRFLGHGFSLLAACSCLPLLQLLGGCQQKSPPPPAESLTVPLAMLPLGQRTNLEHQGKPVELLRTENGVRARSLLCTHLGCKVRWHEDKQQYICPCHEGKFNADGEVVYGMPRRSLATLAVTIAGDEVIVGR